MDGALSPGLLQVHFSCVVTDSALKCDQSPGLSQICSRCFLQNEWRYPEGGSSLKISLPRLGRTRFLIHNHQPEVSTVGFGLALNRITMEETATAFSPCLWLALPQNLSHPELSPSKVDQRPNTMNFLPFDVDSWPSMVATSYRECWPKQKSNILRLHLSLWHKVCSICIQDRGLGPLESAECWFH